MGWIKDRLVNKFNMQMSNVYTSKGCLENISGYICSDGKLNNFLISGGVEPDDRYMPLFSVLDSLIGRIPVIIIHSGDAYIEAMAMESWKIFNLDSEYPTKFWNCNGRNPLFEPFYGMNEMQIVNTLRHLSMKLNYMVTPRFEKVVKAHLSILKALEIPYSLSGLYYLSQFDNIGEFHDNVMALPCEEAVTKCIWADLGADDEGGNGQFDLFRAVINNLAHDAEQSGWNSDNTVCDCNCMQTIMNNGTLVLSINDMYSNMLLPYLTEELKTQGAHQYFILFDGITLKDENLLEYLCIQSSGCTFGIVSENAVDQVGSSEEAFLRVTERMDCIVFFKHGTGKTATILSEVFGKYDYTKIEQSQGVSRGFFKFCPQDRHDDIKYSTENRYRVMPEEILGLMNGQAIIFDMRSDQIIHYN